LITFKDINNINSYTFAGELFHAYQQQEYGNLLEIKNSADQKGRSNIEFEEKFMNLSMGIISGTYYGSFSDMDGVADWILTQIDNNNGNFPTSFSDTQQQEYLSFVNNFQQANIGNGTGYGTPVDPSLNQPNAVISIISNSNCEQ